MILVFGNNHNKVEGNGWIIPVKTILVDLAMIILKRDV